MRIPAFITAGDSAQWVDYPFADGLGASVDSGSYALTYSFRGPQGAGSFDLAGVPQGTAWAFTLDLATSAQLNAGYPVAQRAGNVTWYWHAYATKTGVRLTAGTGTLVARPNLAALPTADAFDGRSQAEQILATVEAAIKARISGDMVTEYTIGQRSLKREPMTELLALRDKYRMVVSRERAAQAMRNGLGNPTRLGVRFKA